jgi:hypothetical protein
MTSSALGEQTIHQLNQRANDRRARPVQLHADWGAGDSIVCCTWEDGAVTVRVRTTLCDTSDLVLESSIDVRERCLAGTSALIEHWNEIAISGSIEALMCFSGLLQL